MRIFYASPGTAHQSCLPQSRVWYYNLYLPLVDLNHQVITFDFDYTEFNYNLDPSVPSQNNFILKNRPKLSDELLRQIRTAHQNKPIDLFFSYFYSSYVDPQAIREIRKMGIKTVNWYCNGSYQFHLVEDIAPAYDYCLVPEKFRMEDYRRVGANPIYCQEAANPNIYRPVDVPREFDVTFVGQKYGERPFYIHHLLNAGIDVRVWGPHWQDPPPKLPLWRRSAGKIKRAILRAEAVFPINIPLERCGPPLSDAELVAMYSRSKINLGFSSVDQKPQDGNVIKQIRLRDFEVPMSGGFYMVEYMEELEEFFDIGKEIVCYSNPEDLAEKTKYYLRHDSARESIRKAGYERCLRDHTWHKRFQMVFDVMELT